MERENGLLVLDGVPICKIIAAYYASNKDSEYVLNQLSIDSDTLEEALEFEEEYPLEVHRDTIKYQRNDLQRELEIRENALNHFLEECAVCGEGEYKPVCKMSDLVVVIDDILYNNDLNVLQCHHCGHRP